MILYIVQIGIYEIHQVVKGALNMYNKLKEIMKNYSIHTKLKRTFASILGSTISGKCQIFCK